MIFYMISLHYVYNSQKKHTTATTTMNGDGSSSTIAYQRSKKSTAKFEESAKQHIESGWLAGVTVNVDDYRMCFHCLRKKTKLVSVCVCVCKFFLLMTALFLGCCVKKNNNIEFQQKKRERKRNNNNINNGINTLYAAQKYTIL